MEPSRQPPSRPSSMPSERPSSKPSSKPSSQPSSKPSQRASLEPSSDPASLPSLQPSAQPSSLPSSKPNPKPSSQLSSEPSSITNTTATSSLTANAGRRNRTKQVNNKWNKQERLDDKPNSNGQRVIGERSYAKLESSENPGLEPSSQPSSRPSTTPSERPSLEPSSKESITEVKLNEMQLRNSTIHAVTAMNAKDIGNGFESICNGLLLIKATGFLVDASICNRTADASLNSNQRSTLTSICKNEMPFDNQPYLETRQAIDPTQR